MTCLRRRHKFDTQITIPSASEASFLAFVYDHHNLVELWPPWLRSRGIGISKSNQAHRSSMRSLVSLIAWIAFFSLGQAAPSQHRGQSTAVDDEQLLEQLIPVPRQSNKKWLQLHEQYAEEMESYKKKVSVGREQLCHGSGTR